MLTVECVDYCYRYSHLNNVIIIIIMSDGQCYRCEAGSQNVYILFNILY